jgi:hypothetical protein
MVKFACSLLPREQELQRENLENKYSKGKLKKATIILFEKNYSI